jgi:AraC-like DNA-binding protein
MHPADPLLTRRRTAIKHRRMPIHDDAGEPGTSPATVLGMLGAMRAIGLRADEIGAAAGVSEAALAARREPLMLGEVAALWRAALRQFGRNTLGLYVAAAHPQGTLLEYVAGASPDLRAGLGQIARYIGLVTHNVRWVLGPREADGLTTFEELATEGSEAIPPSLREFGLAITTSRIFQWFDRRPREVCFAHPAQGPLEDYRQILGCPVRFDRPHMALRFDDEALAAPARRHDPHLFRLLEANAERVLAETPVATSFRAQVRREVVQRLRTGEPAIGAVAQALATSERSLQRRLQSEGVSFRDVVDEARHKMAVVYLGDPTLSLTDVACLLGYSEAAAFTRAFKRWTGRPPSQARG